MMEKEPLKARAIILDNDGNVPIVDYNGCLMFPGGKIEKHENSLNAVEREVKEELGIELEHGNKLFNYHKIIENYPSRYGGIEVAHIINTDYFVFEKQNITLGDVQLTEKEKAVKFHTKIIDVLQLLDYIETHKTDNERWPTFKDEMLTATQKCLEYLGDIK